MLTLYGIKSCDTVRNACAWLDTQHIPYTFFNLKKKEALTPELLKTFFDSLGPGVFNKNSTTWKKLSDAEKNSVTTEAQAITLMIENPSIIKRPILSTGNQMIMGFSASLYEQFNEKHLNKLGIK